MRIAITSDGGNIILNATNEYIQINDTSNVPRVTLSTDSTFPSPNSSGTSVTDSNTSFTDQTEDVGPPSGLGNTDTDSGTLTQDLDSFTAGVGGVHQISYIFDSNGNNQALSATGQASNASLYISVKIYSDTNHTTLIGTLGTWTISAYGFDIYEGVISAVNDTTIMSSTQTRSTNMTLSNGTTYYPRIEATYNIQAVGLGEDDGSRDASVTFSHEGTFKVSSISAGLTANASGLQVNSNDTKVFRLDTSAEDYDPFATIVGNLTLDGLVRWTLFTNGY